MTLPAHFKRVPAPVPVLAGVGAIAGTFLITYPLAASSLSEHPMRLPRVFLSASVSWEPSETVGDFLLSLSVVPVSFAIVARKLELDLRRAQLPRKEAPVGHVPAVFDEARGVEFWAFAANVASIVAAAGACAARPHVHRTVHLFFVVFFYVAASIAAVCHTVVDYSLGNTCDAATRRFRLATSVASALVTPPSLAARIFAEEISDGIVLAAAILEVFAAVCLCAYHLTWARSFATFDVVAGASERSGRRRAYNGDDSFSDDELDALVVRAEATERFDARADLAEIGAGVRLARGGIRAGGGIAGLTTPGWPGSFGGAPPPGPSPSGLPSPGTPRPFAGNAAPTPWRIDGRVVNGLRASPNAPGVPRVDSSDRIYQQLHEPFMRRMEAEGRGQ